MAKTKERKPRANRARQRHLPTMEPPSIPRLDEAANRYYDTMTERVKLNQEEKDALMNVHAIMQEEQIQHYETPDGLVVNYLSSSKTQVKRKKEEKAEENGEADHA